MDDAFSKTASSEEKYVRFFFAFFYGKLIDSFSIDSVESFERKSMHPVGQVFAWDDSTRNLQHAIFSDSSKQNR